MSSNSTIDMATTYPNEINLYPYKPTEILPIIFAAVIAVSLAAHTYQNLSVHLPGSSLPR